MIATDTYGVVLIADVTAEILAQVRQDSLESVRKCSNDLKCILSWEGDTPAGLTATTYTYEQALALVNDVNDEWYIAPPDIPQTP